MVMAPLGVDIESIYFDDSAQANVSSRPVIPTCLVRDWYRYVHVRKEVYSCPN